MKKVSIKQALVNAVDETDESLMRFELQAIRWAKYIEREIGSFNGYTIKAEAFTVDSDVMDVPRGCLKIHRIIYGDFADKLSVMYAGLDTITLVKDIRDSGEDVNISYWAPAETPFVPDVLWEQRIDKVHFVHELGGRMVTILYDVIEVDEHGYWMVAESHIKPIADYIIYMFSKKYLWKSIIRDKLTRNVEISHSRELKADYERSIRNARAKDGEESEYERWQY